MIGQVAAPLVSVVLPVYNGDEHLPEALDSILSQTHRDFELIAVDDGSTDGSGDLLAAYASRDSRVRVWPHRTNAGITASLNDGCRQATGEFVAIANQDDICLPDRLAKQVAYLAAHPEIGAVGAATRIVDQHGTALRLKEYPTDPALASWLMHFFNSLLHPVTMFRRQVLEAVGFYPVGYGGGTEDYALCTRLTRVTRIANLPDVLLHYRVHASNVTKTRWLQQESEADRIVTEHAEYRLGTEVGRTLAGHLRGLSTERFTSDPDTLRALAQTVRRLHDAFARQSGFAPRELVGVHQDAAVRLWVLAGLAAARAPLLAGSLAAGALAMSPASVALLTLKAARVLGQRRRGHARTSNP